MIDLHGLSVQQAKESVIRHIMQASCWGWDKIRFVTGRGNHINAQGERGALFNNFKNWLSPVHDKIANVTQYDGHYEVIVKHNALVPNPLLALMEQMTKHSLQDQIESIKTKAAKGDVNNRITLALCYDKGIAVEHSYHQATKLYLTLAEEKNALAQYEMGCRYFIGKGIKQNDAKAIEYLRLAADQNYMLAEFMLGNIYWRGFGIFPTYQCS